MDILGIDIGGSGIKAAPVDTRQGFLLEEQHLISTPQPATPGAIAEVVSDIVHRFSWTGPVGCGLPTVVRNGLACTAANIDTAWIGTDVQQLFSEAAGCPVNVINDADAAGLAEMRFGAGVGHTGTVLLITVGTGLGSALFRNGALVPNTELGHLDFQGGSAEEYASAAARERLGLSYEEWAKRFGLYLGYLEKLFWPDLFIIGGGVSKRFDRFSPLLTNSVETVPASMKNEAGIIGAAFAASLKQAP